MTNLSFELSITRIASDRRHWLASLTVESTTVKFMILISTIISSPSSLVVTLVYLTLGARVGASVQPRTSLIPCYLLPIWLNTSGAGRASRSEITRFLSPDLMVDIEETARCASVFAQITL